LVAQRLFQGRPQSVTIDNRPGGGSNIGAALVARSAPDGYALLLTSSTQAINVTLYSKLTYNLEKDFIAVGPIANSPAILVVHPSLPVKSVRELIVLAKSRPGELTYASSGSGSTAHLAGELLNMLAGIELRHIPYKGAPPAQTDVMGGNVHSMFGFTSSGVLTHIRSGKLRALGVTSGTRFPDMPELPTLDEVGIKGYEVGAWFGLLAPTGTPSEIVKILNLELSRAVSEVAPKFAALGASPMEATPSEFSSFLRREIEKWSVVVKRSGARVD